MFVHDCERQRLHAARVGMCVCARKHKTSKTLLHLAVHVLRSGARELDQMLHAPVTVFTTVRKPGAVDVLTGHMKAHTPESIAAIKRLLDLDVAAISLIQTFQVSEEGVPEYVPEWTRLDGVDASLMLPERIADTTLLADDAVLRRCVGTCLHSAACPYFTRASEGCCLVHRLCPDAPKPPGTQVCGLVNVMRANNDVILCVPGAVHEFQHRAGKMSLSRQWDIRDMGGCVRDLPDGTTELLLGDGCALWPDCLTSERSNELKPCSAEGCSAHTRSNTSGYTCWHHRCRGTE